MTENGKSHFNKIKDKLKTENPLAFKTGDRLNEIIIALHESQIALNKIQTSSYKTENLRTFGVGLIGIIGVIAGAMIPYILHKNTPEKQEVIQVTVSTHSAAIDTVFVRSDTIIRK